MSVVDHAWMKRFFLETLQNLVDPKLWTSTMEPMLAQMRLDHIEEFWMVVDAEKIEFQLTYTPQESQVPAALVELNFTGDKPEGKWLLSKAVTVLENLGQEEDFESHVVSFLQEQQVTESAGFGLKTTRERGELLLDFTNTQGQPKHVVFRFLLGGGENFLPNPMVIQ